MPHSAGSPYMWLSYAKSDLALAKAQSVSGVMREALCFHAQQAVEKSIKAVLVYNEVSFPKIHSIERLIDLLPSGVPRSSELIASAGLTAFATAFRYPGEEEPVTHEEYEMAVNLADAVIKWAEENILPEE